MIADQNVGVDFTTSANIASADMPKSLTVTKILADGQDPPAASQQILAALNSGSLLVNCVGHGSEEQWSFSDLLDNTSAASLSTSLLLAPKGGAEAV